MLCLVAAILYLAACSPGQCHSTHTFESAISIEEPLSQGSNGSQQGSGGPPRWVDRELYRPPTRCIRAKYAKCAKKSARILYNSILATSGGAHPFFLWFPKAHKCGKSSWKPQTDCIFFKSQPPPPHPKIQGQIQGQYFLETKGPIRFLIP